MVRVLVYAVPFILLVWALVDLVQTRGTDVRRMPKAVWLFAIVVVPVIGPICWLTLGRRRGAPPVQPPPPTRPVAPDDDPEFLRGLEQERRRREREAGSADPDPDAPAR